MSKRDCRGRTWRSADVRQKLIAEFQESKCSVAVFCKERNISSGTFYKWLANERKQEVSPIFKEVQMAMPAAGREVRVTLPNRVVVSVPVDSSAELSFVLREAARC